MSGMGCVLRPIDEASVHVRRTSLAWLVPDSIPTIGVTLVRPRPTWSGDWGNPLIEFNSVQRSQSYIGDTQYMTKISIKKFSKSAWDEQFRREQDRIAKMPTCEWREFQKWAYSEPLTTTMRESNGYRNYLRVIKDAKVGVVKIWAEHNCFQREHIDEDDTIIRRIIDSVSVDSKIITTPEPKPDGDGLKPAP